MNPNTAWIPTLACAAALAWGSATAAPASEAGEVGAARTNMAGGLDRDQLRARMADCGLPPARELARAITRQIVERQGNEPGLGVSFGVRGAQRTRSLPTVSVAKPGRDDLHDSGKAPGEALLRLREELRKITGLLEFWK